MTRTHDPTHPGFELVCAARKADLDADAPEILIVPAGRVETKSLGSFVMDSQAGDMVIGEFRQHGTDLPIDYEHATIYRGERGESAPATGWIKDLRFDDQRGLLGSVSWTEEGRDAIRTDKYKYLSPVIAIRKSDSRVAALHSIALTNKPEIRNMAALAASEKLAGFLRTLTLAQNPPPAGGKDTSGDPIDGGGDGPGPSPGVQAASNPKVRESVFALLAQARDLLGMASDVTPKGVVLELGAFVEAASAEQETDTNAMRERIRREVTQERELEDLLVQYSRENKLHLQNDSVMRAARTLASRDLEAFKALMGSLPAKVPPGRTTPPTPEQVQEHTVTRDARMEFQTHRAELSKWTSEEAFVAMKLREAGITAR